MARVRWDQYYTVLTQLEAAAMILESTRTTPKAQAESSLWARRTSGSWTSQTFHSGSHSILGPVQPVLLVVPLGSVVIVLVCPELVQMDT